MLIYFFFIIVTIIDTMTNIERNPENKKKEMLHIWVHGTAEGLHLYKENFFPKFSFKGLYNSLLSMFSLRNDLHRREFLYANIIFFGDYKKRAKLFAENEWPVLMGCYPGLSKIGHPKSLCPTKTYCRLCVSGIAYNYLFNQFMAESKLAYPDYDHTGYMFNWCGDLSDEDRQAAGTLLAFEIERIYATRPNACIKIYAHSHGGNAVLYAATLLSKKNILIDAVVFLGTPIGIKTNQWIEKVSNIRILLNFYSKNDFIQIGDLFFNKGLCSRKLPEMSFIKNIELSLYDESKVEIAINHAMFYFLWKRDPSLCVLLYLPNLMREIEQTNKINIKWKLYKNKFH